MNIQIKSCAVSCAVILAMFWVSATYARTYRSCNVELYFVSEQFQTDGVWREHATRLKLNAGRMEYRASAPSGSPNKARMRASKKAETCINRWWNGHCLDARSTSYGSRHGHTGIRTLMNEAICADLRAVGRLDMLGRQMRGRLYGRIDGDRCCRDSSRGCPYNYGQSRVGRFNSSGLGGNELWPGVTYYVICNTH